MTSVREPKPRLVTMPSSDLAFRDYVTGIAMDWADGAAALERRLRRIFPRVVVRERELFGELPVWYVYRDGGWLSAEPPWWHDSTLPYVLVTPDGWLSGASVTAAGLLGIRADEAAEHHYTDFIVPGTLDDARALFSVIDGGSELTATVLLRPLSGHVIAVDLHASKSDDAVKGVLRLAAHVDVSVDVPQIPAPVSVATKPASDVAFKVYVLRALGRMPEPTADGLALRLRRLYPHAVVTADGDSWVAEREPSADAQSDQAWWSDGTLPRVRYDAQALILEANAAAQEFLGHELVGHYWQDFVTAGSTEEVSVMLEILAEVGAAASRFRMPSADGTLVEFDSYTAVTGEEFVTVMRPVS
jgi:PAS domain-containing protein